VPDLKPPRISAGERETLHVLLQYQRDSLVRKITGTGEAAAADIGLAALDAVLAAWDPLDGSGVEDDLA